VNANGTMNKRMYNNLLHVTYYYPFGFLQLSHNTYQALCWNIIPKLHIYLSHTSVSNFAYFKC
jgi:hypothetical protein